MSTISLFREVIVPISSRSRVQDPGSAGVWGLGSGVWSLETGVSKLKKSRQEDEECDLDLGGIGIIFWTSFFSLETIAQLVRQMEKLIKLTSSTRLRSQGFPESSGGIIILELCV